MTRALVWLVGVGLAPALPALAGDAEDKKRLLELYSVTPLRFERNQGQTDASVEYLARGAGYGLFLRNTEAVLALSGTSPSGERGTATVRMKLVGANREAVVSGLDELPGRSHYFIGNDPARWHTGVTHYAQVRYRQVYPGIDLVFHGRQGRFEYDFVVGPGADPRRIRFAWEGARRVRLESEGDLVLEVGPGELILQPPVVYQETSGGRRTIPGRYVLKGKREVAFELGSYDRRAALVIDPVLAYSTYLGGSKSDSALAMALDPSGNVYVTGETESMDFPTAGTPLQPSNAGGIRDVFVTKLDPSSALIYSTYLGGTDHDEAFGIAVDAAGSTYVTGRTRSTDFPTAGTPSQANHAGGEDVFVVKLGPASALVYSTFAGGSSDDVGQDVAVDGLGNAYVAGFTGSMDFPTAGTPSQPTHGGGGRDAFVMKLDSASGRLYSTYLGGSGNDGIAGARNRAVRLAVDAAGNAYVTGGTQSTDFPTAGTPSQGAFAGDSDAFVTKLGPASQRVYSTYLGGSGNDRAATIVHDPVGNAYVTGLTSSSDFPTAGTPSQPAYAGGNDAFMTKLGPDSGRLLSTYLGGSGYEESHGLAVDVFGFIYLAGSTCSSDFPTAGVPLQATLTGPCDAFVTRMDAGSALTYSSYLGGSGSEAPDAVVVDGSGNTYIAGFTNSTDFPTAGTPAQPNYGGGLADAFVAKIFEPNPAVSFFTVSPCRVVDTRRPAGPLGGPGLAAGADRSFTIVGACGIPATAKAVSVNLAVTGSTTAGNLRLYPGGGPLPPASSINYAAGQTRSNNATVTLNTTGQIAVRCAQASGTAHFILDVNGYFE